MNTLLLESALLPCGWTDNVEVNIDQQGRISSVKADTEASNGTFVKGCCLPGIPNVHSHAHQRAMVGLAERATAGDDDFWSWRAAMYNCLQKIQPQHLQAIASQLYVEMLKFGYTNVGEFQYLHHDPNGDPYADRAEMSLQILQAAQRAGIGITLLPVLYRYAGFGGGEPDAQQQRFINDAEGFNAIVASLQHASATCTNVSIGIAPHSLRAVTPELLRELLPERNASPIHIHIAEQSAEVDACIDWSGQRPVTWLLNNCLVDESWCLVHATHITSQELERIAASGAVVGLCPTTEANLGDGLFPAADYLRAGGHIGLGSDSQVCVSAAEEMRWLEYGQRLTERKRNILSVPGKYSTGRTVFEAVLAGGARASGQMIGRLAEGYRADLVVLDTNHPRLAGRNGDTLLDAWIFACDDNPIREVWVAGNRVVVDGHHVCEEQIRAAFDTAMFDLRQR